MSNKSGRVKDNQPCLNYVTVNSQFNVHWISQTNIRKKKSRNCHQSIFFSCCIEYLHNEHLANGETDSIYVEIPLPVPGPGTGI